ncbi:unnamed protein product [Caenorhabditis bovis]|uniref:Rap guanine nucleotide exchange factor 4 n=1 Tax=Caenorhabditis bovis TaxID=2654633 RepID=A0A8S1EYT7_9PELO|nr:unnamed protein product [Caenorhabditis bovis]
MDRLVSRVRRIPPLHSISDALLISLLSNSEPQPESIQQGVILFEKDEPTAYWYLLISGEVQLFRRSRNGEFRNLKTLRSGSLFGDLSTPSHSCSALVSRPAQLVRISQQHFLSIYNKHGDHLQPFIVIMHDILLDAETPLEPLPSSLYTGHPNMEAKPPEFRRMMPSPPNGVHLKPRTLPFINGAAKNGHHHHAQQKSRQIDVDKSFIEFRSTLSIEGQILESGQFLQRRMLTDGHHVIRDAVVHNTTLHNCMLGCEMVDWLLTLFVSTSTHPTSLSRLQMSAIWQVLLDSNVIVNIDGDHKFMDKSTAIFRWAVQIPESQKIAPNLEDITQVISFLSSVAPETLFLMILSIPGYNRSPEELEVVYEEMMHIKALSHLSTMVKRQLATVVEIEKFPHAGSVVFRQGEIGDHWYIVLKGAVDVNVHGKGVVCVLHEGDDFGKLALVNDSPRAATIVTREDDSIFLIIDKHHFNQILRQVEANTVRLREFGDDVLVLEKIEFPRGAALENSNSVSSTCGYSVMAGKAEKILEYVLETRIDAQPEDLSEIDVFLEDFILTHEAFMPTNAVCNYLKSYYFRPPFNVAPSSMIDTFADDVCSKRRVVQFLHVWSSLLRVNFFLNPASNSFIEEMYCHVIEDQKRIDGMREIGHRMAALRATRENMQLLLSRHPATVLDCGVLSAHTPIPILPSDICNQIIHLADTTCFVLPIRVDKTAEEICELSRRRMRCYTVDPLILVEVKSNGEKLIFDPNDRAIPTVLSLNSKVYVVHREEVDMLTPMDDQNGPSTSQSSVLQLIDAQELAHQLFTFHMQLVRATDASELLFQVIGRESFPLSMPFNLDLLVRRFNEVQHWATTEVLLATDANRVDVLKKFIKIAAYARENQDLLTVFAVTLGLSHISVSRLTMTWNRLPSKCKKKFVEFENLLDPSRNHRLYRMLVAKMNPPYIPFIPLILKDLMFIHQGNKSFYNGLVNFEKMHMFANVLRGFRQCKVTVNQNPETDVVESQCLIRNLRVIDNQQRLMQLSYEIEAKTTKRNEYK